MEYRLTTNKFWPVQVARPDLSEGIWEDLTIENVVERLNALDAHLTVAAYALDLSSEHIRRQHDRSLWQRILNRDALRC